MNTRVLLSLALPLSMMACSSQSLFQQTKDTLAVTSTPSGASVYVMQKQVGVTPITLPTQEIFPLTFPSEQLNDYGRITLKQEGCETQTVMVDANALRQGMNLKLNCEQVSQQPPSAPNSADIPIKKRLQQLQALKDEHLISDAEFEKIRQRILDEF
jgi:hypothetical protein